MWDVKESVQLWFFSAQQAQKAIRIKMRKFMHRLGIHWQIELNKQSKVVTSGISTNSLLAFLGQCIYPEGDSFVQDRIKSVNNPTVGKEGFDPLFFCAPLKKKKKSFIYTMETFSYEQLSDRQMKPYIKMNASVYQNQNWIYITKCLPDSHLVLWTVKGEVNRGIWCLSWIDNTQTIPL